MSETIHIITLVHRHGEDVFASRTVEDVRSQLAQYCCEYWNEARQWDSDLPEDPPNADEEVITAYFDSVSDEYFNEHTVTI